MRTIVLSAFMLVLLTSCESGQEDALSDAGNAEQPVVSAGDGGSEAIDTTDGEAVEPTSTAEPATTAETTTSEASTSETTSQPSTTVVTAAPTTVATTAAPTTTGAGDVEELFPGESSSFSSPSGNITCVISAAGGASCIISEKEWSIAQPEGCEDYDWGNAMSVGESGGTFPCYTDYIWDPQAPVLDYGKAVNVGTYRCASARTGVTCTNGAGNGFKIARAQAELL